MQILNFGITLLVKAWFPHPLIVTRIREPDFIRT